MSAPKTYLFQDLMNPLAECLAGGLATCGACLFTNPLETVKTRMQLQGELQMRGTYTVHYRNVFHAFYTIAKVDGIAALQNGLAPALSYQFVMNGIRLGTYQIMTNARFTVDSKGEISYVRCLLAGALSGSIGATCSSPMFMVKIHMQSKSRIAVGTQHDVTSMRHAFKTIYSAHGISGLWRGASSSIARVSVGSSAQLSAFSISKDWVLKSGLCRADSFMLSVASSMIASVFVVVAMTPFDVVATRLYNQGVSSTGRGVIYINLFDVFRQVYKKEGVFGFYKGLGAHYFRLGPHTIIGLVLWDLIRKACQ